MLYIAHEDRAPLEPQSDRDAMTMGELAFQLTALVDQYLANNLDSQAIGEAVGALTCTQLEMYRRIAAPYEDQKIDLNGDVYETKVRPFGKLREKQQS